MAIAPALPPTLPHGRVLPIAGRGELFVRTVDGPPNAVPVVLIHGWQATADVNFHPLFDVVGRTHPVIAADLRGHGRSLYPETPFTLADAADDHAALLRDLGIDRAIVVGYSIGCAVAQTFVERHRGLVERLVLVAGELGGRRRPHEHVYNRVGGWFGTGQRLTSGRWAAHRLLDKAEREAPVAARHQRAWLVAEMERGHTASIRAAGRALASFDGRPIAGAHAAGLHTTVVLTTRDKAIRPARQRALAEVWKATVVELDADHDAPVAQPAAFIDAVVEGLARGRT
jgi:pimeloyl-ACP methyl ester carboxylesterase